MANEIFIHALIWPLVVMLATASILSRLGEWLGAPRFVGAILAGLLLGPMVVGKFLPAVDRLIFSGGGPEYHELQTVIRERDTDLATLKGTGVTEEAIREKSQAYEKLIEGRKAALQVAQLDFSEPIDMLMAAVVFPVVLIRLGIRITGGDPKASSRPLLPMIWLGPMTAMAIAGAFAGWPGVWGAAAVSGLTLGWFGLPRTTLRAISIEALEPLLWCYLMMQIQF